MPSNGVTECLSISKRVVATASGNYIIGENAQDNKKGHASRHTQNIAPIFNDIANNKHDEGSEGVESSASQDAEKKHEVEDEITSVSIATSTRKSSTRGSSSSVTCSSVRSFIEAVETPSKNTCSSHTPSHTAMADEVMTASVSIISAAAATTSGANHLASKATHTSNINKLDDAVLDEVPSEFCVSVVTASGTPNAVQRGNAHGQSATNVVTIIPFGITPAPSHCDDSPLSCRATARMPRVSTEGKPVAPVLVPATPPSLNSGSHVISAGRRTKQVSIPSENGLHMQEIQMVLREKWTRKALVSRGKEYMVIEEEILNGDGPLAVFPVPSSSTLHSPHSSSGPFPSEGAPTSILSTRVPVPPAHIPTSTPFRTMFTPIGGVVDEVMTPLNSGVNEHAPQLRIPLATAESSSRGTTQHPSPSAATTSGGDRVAGKRWGGAPHLTPTSLSNCSVASDSIVASAPNTPRSTLSSVKSEYVRRGTVGTSDLAFQSPSLPAECKGSLVVSGGEPRRVYRINSRSGTLHSLHSCSVMTDAVEMDISETGSFTLPAAMGSTSVNSGFTRRDSDNGTPKAGVAVKRSFKTLLMTSTTPQHKSKRMNVVGWDGNSAGQEEEVEDEVEGAEDPMVAANQHHLSVSRCDLLPITPKTGMIRRGASGLTAWPSNRAGDAEYNDMASIATEDGVAMCVMGESAILAVAPQGPRLSICNGTDPVIDEVDGTAVVEEQ